MAISIFEKNGQQIEVPTEALGKAMSDVSGGYVTGQTEQQRLESQGYKLLSPYSGANVVDNTNQIRTDLNTLNTNINDVVPSGYDFNQTSYLSQSQKDELARLDAMAKGIGTLNDEDRAAIEAAGVAAGMKYDPLISEAKEEKRKGMPKAVISAGERGGFMSTQMAGVSALAQTEGGDWIGAGGELENIKSVYDTNIQNLQVAKERAIAEAKAAAEAARLTGKRQDMQAARDAFEFAQNANLKAIQLSNEKVAAISNWEKLQTQRIATRMPSLLESMTDDETSNAKTLENFATQYGYDKDLVKNTLMTYEKGIQDDALNTISKKIAIAKTIPKGDTYKDEASGLTIIGSADPETLEVSQVVGNNEYLVKYDLSDPNNPREMFRINLGAKWKPDSGNGTDTTKMFEGMDAAQGLIQAAKVLQSYKDKGNQMFNATTYDIVIDTFMDTFYVYDPTDKDRENVVNKVNDYLRAFENGTKKEEEYVNQVSQNVFNAVDNLEKIKQQQSATSRNIFERILGTDIEKASRTATTSVGGTSFGGLQNNNDLSTLSITK